MEKFNNICPYKDSEIIDVLKEFRHHPMINAFLTFTFPNKNIEEIHSILDKCYDKQVWLSSVVFESISRTLKMSSEELICEGLENLDKNKPYLFLSTHRDIILDSSILNLSLFRNNFPTSYTAIGDNLVKKPFLKKLAKLSNCFFIKRDTTPRELLNNSFLLSDYIKTKINNGSSVWIAQREGRTKNGDDQTQQGVIKMLGLTKNKLEISEYLKEFNIVPVTISYEYDPTDILKMPELLAKQREEEYIKTPSEDFNTILKGALGKKGRINITYSEPINEKLTEITKEGGSVNGQIRKIKDYIDLKVHKKYKLWPSNYIAYDLLYGGVKFFDKYTDKEKRIFDRRIERRVEKNNKMAYASFLEMYATPVVNKLKINK